MKDFLWLNIRELPYFRALVRAVEAGFYQQFELAEPVLDVGCGDGQFAKETFDRPLDVGLDPWGPPIHEAGTTGAYRLLVQCDGARTPFPDGYFASAISNSVLEHIPHIQDVLNETGRVLRPGAVFVFCVPNPDYLGALSIPAFLRRIGLRRLADAYTDWFRRMSRVQHAESPEVWAGWLEKAGFRLERWWHYFPPKAMHTLEWGHYFGAPSLVARWIFKRWILAPYHWNLALTEAITRPLSAPVEHPEGTFTFFVARKI